MRSAHLLTLGFIMFISVGIGGCGAPSPTPLSEGVIEMTIQISSSAFSDGGTIPTRHTCDGDDISPPLAWSGIPEGTVSLALISDDPDAPVGTWVHWVLFNVPPDTTSLREGVSGVGVNGRNDFRRLGYGGPCPPKGPAHRYYFKLYALDAMLNLKEGAAKKEVEKAMQGHILAQGQLMGKYGR